MNKQKREISTPKIKKVYFDGIERAGRAYHGQGQLTYLSYSNEPTLSKLKKAKEDLSKLKDTHEFNKFNEGVLGEKAGRIIDCEEELFRADAEVQKNIEVANRLIKEINRQIALTRQGIYEKYFLDPKDV